MDVSLKRILLCFSFKKFNLFVFKLLECCCFFLSLVNVILFNLVFIFCIVVVNKIVFSIKF